MKIRIDATREEVETGCYLAQDCFHCPLEYRLLRACDYGAPTIRKRFFLIARCDGQKIVWPEPTHAAPESLEVLMGIKKPWVPVADVLDFSLPCPSIFSTSEEIMEHRGIL